SFALDSNGYLYSWGYNGNGQFGNNTTTGSNVPVASRVESKRQLSLTIGGNVASISSQIESAIEFIAPAHNVGLVDILISSTVGDSNTLSDAYEYVEKPIITNISPNTGSISGGDTVIISGANFSSGSKVYFENNEAAVSGITSNTITITTPSSLTSGPVNVKILDTVGQSDTSYKGFIYKVSTPIILNLTPNKGSVAGGQSVTLNGTGLTNETKFKQVSQGSNHSCGVTDMGKIYCWGANTYGQLGNGTTTASSKPVEVKTDGVLKDKTIIAVSASGFYSASLSYGSSIALCSDGTVYAWGYNGYGELGNGTVTNSSVPVSVNMSGVLKDKVISKVYTSGYGTAVIDSEGKVYTFGRNAYGELGNGTTTNSSNPVAVDTSGVLAGKNIVKIAISHTHMIALDSEGKVYGWGINGSGQLGDGSTTSKTTPISVNTTGILSGKVIKDIATENFDVSGHTVAVDSDGIVYAWGLNTSGQLGNNSTTQSILPVAVDMTGVLFNKIIKSVSVDSYAVGLANTLVTDTNGRVYGWGYNAYGQLGNGLNTNSLVPVKSDVDNLFAELTLTGGSTSSILTSNGQIYSWGYNNTGQLGNNTTANSLTPVPLDRTNLSKQSIISNLSLGGNTTNINTVTDTALTFNTPAHSAGLVDLVW
ncbi:hypothetical protein CVV43_05555, partial [Candidatus Saccharibacteria bacterium HGW-Saccharibacteria-1]